MKTDHLVSLVSDVKFKCDRFIVSELKRNGINDLAPSHGGILNSLYMHGKMTMKELSRSIDRDKSTVTTLVNKLIDLGYIVKYQDSTDKRVYFIELSKKGKELKPVFELVSDSLMKKFKQDINENEAGVLGKVLEKIIKGW